MYYIKFKEKYARWLSPLDVMWVSDVLDASGVPKLYVTLYPPMPIA